MCGIFAAIKLKGAFNDTDQVQFELATDRVQHRGPDARGGQRYTLNSAINQTAYFDAFLGHRRLSIIDLSADGIQPFNRNNLSIVFNGEIFNYIELREELIKKGYVFKTQTDTEVILATYEAYGVQGFSQFNGMWAFVLIDKSKGLIHVCRDRFSIKPLYYYTNDNAYYFASEIKQLLPFVKEKKINNDTMFLFLQQSVMEQGNESFFQGIERVEAKTCWTLNMRKEGELTKTKYWDYSPALLNPSLIEEEFRYLMTDSIALRLRSDVPVGALLSGGLDSSIITQIAHQKADIHSFSIISDDVESSEEKFVDILVKSASLKNTKLNFESKHVLALLDKVVWHQDEPFAGLSIVAQHIIYQLIKEQNITVILSGQGGDELLCGYLKYYFFYIKELLNKGSFLKAGDEILSALYNRTIINQFSFKDAKRYLPWAMKTNNDYLTISGKVENHWQLNSLKERQKDDIDKFSVPILNRYEDRNSMAYGIESRLPFLDHRLVDFCLNLEYQQKINRGWNKHILRKAFHELPNDIRYRKDKKGFTTPDALWLKTDLKQNIFTSMKNSKLQELGIINEKKFLDHYANFLQGKATISSKDIFSIFIAELWAKQHFN